ncbi:hypothetical protein Cph01nite_33180 [Cellulomonas phragmiteti]|uniref:Uncharacterized protein n=1 Tax=Cellulomonas phragmiteti TaxID=478780 RepID=A0ABQ4DRK0_9CELL|nr:hypothetical protein Cph01nite_33180 [Cellulomonas phragmiteti]
MRAWAGTPHAGSEAGVRTFIVYSIVPGGSTHTLTRRGVAAASSSQVSQPLWMVGVQRSPADRMADRTDRQVRRDRPVGGRPRAAGVRAPRHGVTPAARAVSQG